VLSVAVAGVLGGLAGVAGGAAAGVLAALAGLAGPWLLDVAASRAVTARDRARLLRSLAPPGIMAGARRHSDPVAERGVAELLRAEDCPVPFRHRAELDELVSWCESGPPVTARLMIGQGGTGKTRLALQLCEIMQATGWTALWVGDDEQEKHALEAVQGELGGPVLLVVDYAEGRQELPKLLNCLPWDQPGRKVRVLMLARSAGGWWADRLLPKVTHKAERHLKPGMQLRLPSYFAPSERQGLIDSAVTAFAGLLGIAEETVDTVNVQRDGGSVMLVTLANALLAVLGDAAAREGSDVLEALLRHEERYWVKSAAARGLSLDLRVLRQAVAAACLITVNSRASACEVLLCIRELRASPEKCGQAAEWLHDLYPPGAAEGVGTPGWIGPLRPGLIAESLVISTMAADPDLFKCLLRKANENQAYQALTILTRAAATWPTAVDLLRTGLSANFRALAAPAVRAVVASDTRLAETISAILARRRQVPEETLSRMLDQIPESSPDLADLALAVLRRLCKLRPDGTQARATLLTRLSSRLVDASQFQEALGPAREATAIYRVLAAMDPDQFQPALRGSLEKLGTQLAAAGLADEATAVRAEASRIDARRLFTQAEGLRSKKPSQSAAPARYVPPPKAPDNPKAPLKRGELRSTRADQLQQRDMEREREP
jgi:hypothetical protein